MVRKMFETYPQRARDLKKRLNDLSYAKQTQPEGKLRLHFLFSASAIRNRSSGFRDRFDSDERRSPSRSEPFRRGKHKVEENSLGKGDPKLVKVEDQLLRNQERQADAHEVGFVDASESRVHAFKRLILLREGRFHRRRDGATSTEKIQRFLYRQSTLIGGRIGRRTA
ncbi:unnamed protein product [Cochlearia groenlandica]